MNDPKNSSTRNLAFLLTGKFVSELGNGVYYIALSWFVLSTNTGIGDFALLLTINALPSLVIAPVVGVFIDRHNKKRILQICDAAQSIVFGSLTIAFALQHDHIAIFAAVSLLNGIIRTVSEPTIKATFPFLAQQTHLQRVNSIDAVIRSSTNLLGFFVGGVLVALFGVVGCFVFIFAGFAVATLCDSLISLQQPARLGESHDLKSLIAGIRVGFRSAFATRDLALLFAFTTILTFFVMPSGYLLFPIVLKNIFQFNESLFGIIQAGFPGGIVLGSLVIMFTKSAEVVSPIKYFVGGAAGMSLSILIWAGVIWLESKSILLNATLLTSSVVMMGIINVVITVKSTTFVQRTVDKRLLGKVLSIQELAYTAAVPLGLLAFSGAIAIFRIAEEPRAIGDIFVSLAVVIPVLFATIILYSKRGHVQTK